MVGPGPLGVWQGPRLGPQGIFKELIDTYCLQSFSTLFLSIDLHIFMLVRLHMIFKFSIQYDVIFLRRGCLIFYLWVHWVVLKICEVLAGLNP